MADLDPRDSLPLPPEDSSIGADPRGAHHGPGMGAEALEMAEIGSASATTTASTAVPGASTAGGQAAETAQRPPMTGEPRQRWRLVISRAPDAPLQTPGAWQAGWEQALAASALPILWTGSRRARPRFVPALPLPAGTAADRELADIFLANRLPRGTVREAIEHVAPTGHALVDCHDVWVGAPSLPAQVVAAEYTIELAGPWPDEGRAATAVAAILAADRLTRQRARGDRHIEYDLRPLILQLALGKIRAEVHAGGSDRGAEGADTRATVAANVDGARAGRVGATVLALRMRLRHDPERGSGRPDELLLELGDRLGTELRPSLTRRTRILLAGDLRRANEPPAVRHGSAVEED